MASKARDALTLLVAAAISAEAQGVVTLRGLAYDSVAARPLVGAFITLDGARSTTSGSGGAFAFDSVSPGVHRFDMVHAVLDSMGLPGVATQFRVTDGGDVAVISVPSFATLWRAACGERLAPDDSAFVYGTVRSAADGDLLGGARVELAWSDFTLLNIRTITGKRYLAEVDADERGEYAVCGVPRDAGLRVQARVADGASGLLDIGLTRLRVIRRDLLVGPLDTAVVGPRGTIVGIVTDTAGRPFTGATIVLDDVQQMRTEDDGRFRLSNILPGTRQIEIIAIGVRPQLHIVDVVAGEQVTVAATMQRVTTLDVVRIIGSRWQTRMLEGLEDRRRQGFGSFRDSLALGRRPTMLSVFAGLPSVDVRPLPGGRVAVLFPGLMGRRCSAIIYVDGIKSNMDELASMLPQDIAVMESYPRRSLVPSQFQLVTNECGVIVIWTKRMMP